MIKQFGTIGSPTISVLNLLLTGQVIDFPIGETHSKIKDVPKFELGDKIRILRGTAEDNLELGITLKLFSQDLWETK